MERPWCSGRWLGRPRLHALQRHEKVGSMMVCLTIHGGTIALFEGRVPVSAIFQKCFVTLVSNYCAEHLLTPTQTRSVDTEQINMRKGRSTRGRGRGGHALASFPQYEMRPFIKHSAGCPIGSDSWVGLTWIQVFLYLAQLLSHFCQLPISPSRTRQKVGQPKSKSTQSNYQSRWTTLYE